MVCWGVVCLTADLTTLLRTGVSRPSFTAPCDLFMNVAYVRNRPKPAPVEGGGDHFVTPTLTTITPPPHPYSTHHTSYSTHLPLPPHTSHSNLLVSQAFCDAALIHRFEF